MTLDVQTVEHGLRQLAPRELRVSLATVDAYVKAFYIPLAELGSWAQLHPEYSKEQVRRQEVEKGWVGGRMRCIKRWQQGRSQRVQTTTQPQWCRVFHALHHSLHSQTHARRTPKSSPPFPHSQMLALATCMAESSGLRRKERTAMLALLEASLSEH